MNPKWYPGYDLDPKNWPEWMPEAMDPWPPPRSKSIEEQRAELPTLLPDVSKSPWPNPNADLLWSGLVPAPPQPEPLPNSPLPANAAKSLPPLFPRWPDYVMTISEP